MTEIILNRIDTSTIKINKVELDSRYNFFKIRRISKNFWESSPLLSPTNKDKCISAIQYSGISHEIYIMGDKRLTMSTINQYINEEKYSNDYKPTQIYANYFEQNQRLLLQLLLNSLANIEHPKYKVNNTTGHLFCTFKKWINKTQKQIKMLEVSVDKNLNILISVKTLTSLKRVSELNIPDDKLKFMTRYVLGTNNAILRADFNDSKSEKFIIAQIPGQKSSVTFLGLTSDTFDRTKISVLSDLIIELKERYEDCIEFDFVRKIYTDEILRQKRTNDNLKDRIRSYAENNEIVILRDENDQDIAKQIADFKAACDLVNIRIQTKEKKRFWKGDKALSFIHEPKFYTTNKEEDPYQKDSGKLIQHITPSCNFQPKWKTSKYDENIKIPDLTEVEPTIMNIFKELMLKEDVINKKITFYDWEDLNLTQDMSFIKPEAVTITNEKTKKSLKKYYFHSITVHPDGTFEACKIKAKDNSYSKYYQIVKEYDIRHETIEGIVEYDTSINVIVATHLFPIPDLEEYQKALDITNSIRRAPYTKDLIYDCLNIKVFKLDENVHYTVGPAIKLSLKTKIPNSSPARRIDSTEGSDNLSEILLPMLDVAFVKYMQTTVKPFPFKYLEEYFRIYNHS